MDMLAYLTQMQAQNQAPAAPVAPAAPAAPSPAMNPALLRQLVDAGLVNDRADVLAQQMRRAQGLMDTPTAQGMRVGGTYRAASPFEHLAVAMSRIVGNRKAKGLDQQMGGLIDQRGAAREAYANAGTPPVLGALSGDPAMNAAGQVQAAQTQQGVENQLAGQRIQAANTQAEAEAQRRAAEAARAERAQAETERANRAREANDQARLTQDAYTVAPNPLTGGAVVLNKKTGATQMLGPDGAGGAPPPPKPKDLENDVQALGKDLEPLAKMREDLAVLDAVANSTSDVPGFGPIQGRIPDVMTSRDGIAVRQSAGRLMAQLLFMQSGSTVSEQEVQRALEARGLGKTASPEAFRQGVAALAREHQDIVSQRKAKYHPDVVRVYDQRGGFTGAQPAQPGAQPAAQPAAGAAAPAQPAQPPLRLKAKNGKFYLLGGGGWELDPNQGEDDAAQP